MAVQPGFAQVRLLMPERYRPLPPGARTLRCGPGAHPAGLCTPYPGGMSPEGLPPPPPPPPRDKRGPGRSLRGDQGMPKWGLWVLLGLTLVIVLSSSFATGDSGEEISYS